MLFQPIRARVIWKLYYNKQYKKFSRQKLVLLSKTDKITSLCSVVFCIVQCSQLNDVRVQLEVAFKPLEKY